MKKNLGDAMLELTPEQLKTISGGTYTAQQAAQLSGYLKIAKDSGMTKDQVLSMVPGLFSALSSSYPDVTLSEVNAFINSQWDSL